MVSLSQGSGIFFMTTKIQKKTMMCVVMLLSFLMALGVLTFNTYEIAQAQAFEQSIPTFGLYCEDEGIIESGTVKFDLTNSELFSKQKAREESEYRVSGNQAVTFEIPFISSYIDIPQFDVTVNGQAVEGEIWYGDNQKRYGGNNSYLDATSTDNSIIEQKLRMTYSPILDETIIGTLYTVTPNADTMTITLNLEKSCSYVYDGTNRRTESYSPDGTQSWGYENALSRSSYQYFFIGENTVIDFSTTCEFQTQEITFKDFIDRNYNTEKEFYDDAGVPTSCIYSIANRLLHNKGGMAFSELFYDSLSRVDLNSYKFIVPLNGEATIKFTMEAMIQVSNRYNPPIYIIGQKQLGSYTTNYSMALNGNVKHLIQSSVNTKKSGETYTASATENFYFICSSAKNPTDTKNPTQAGLSQTQLIVCIVCGIVGGIALICLGVSVGFIIRDKRRAK